jgi:circadian clock protein KaiC
MKKPARKTSNNNFPKSPSGIHGFDEITDGGLHESRPTLVYGSAGCGKTLFELSFLFAAPLSLTNLGYLCRSKKPMKN